MNRKEICRGPECVPDGVAGWAAVIWVPMWSLQAALRHDEAAWERPVALLGAARDRGQGPGPVRVIAMTPSARDMGVELDQSSTQAMARCAGVECRHRLSALEQAARDALLQVAFQFSPSVEETAEGCLTLDLRGLTPFGPGGAADADERSQRAWARELRARVEALGFRGIRLGLGPGWTLARHAARFGVQVGGEWEAERICRVCGTPEQVRTFLDRLPMEALEPSDDVAAILKGWGIRTVGQFLGLDPGEVADRLGLESLALRAAASPRDGRPLRLVRPVDRYLESHEWEQPVETLDPLLFLLRRLMEVLARRMDLGEGRRQVGAMTLQLRLEDGGQWSRSLTVPEPTSRVDVLFRMMHTLLETVRTESAIVGMTLEWLPAMAVPRQLGLFEAVLKDPTGFRETLARLSALVGSDRVGTPVRGDGHRPDTFRLVPPRFEDARDPAALRTREPMDSLDRRVPRRRVRPAEPVEVRRNVPTPAGNPDAGTRGNTGGRLDAGQVAAWLDPVFRPVDLRTGNGHGVDRCSPPVGSARALVQAVRDPAWVAGLRADWGNGPVRGSRGPWKMSGGWWEGGGWSSEEWLVETHRGVVVGLSWDGTGWTVSSVLD